MPLVLQRLWRLISPWQAILSTRLKPARRHLFTCSREDFALKLPTLEKDYNVPIYFCDDSNYTNASGASAKRADLFSVLGQESRPDFPLAYLRAQAIGLYLPYRPQPDECVECECSGSEKVDFLSAPGQPTRCRVVR